MKARLKVILPIRANRRRRAQASISLLVVLEVTHCVICRLGASSSLWERKQLNGPRPATQLDAQLFPPWGISPT
jgi:hypothetical protein